jgi:hypothetical protein
VTALSELVAEARKRSNLDIPLSAEDLIRRLADSLEAAQRRSELPALSVFASLIDSYEQSGDEYAAVYDAEGRCVDSAPARAVLALLNRECGSSS